MNPSKVALLRSLIEASKRLVVLTGAGMSTESGIPDFRSAGGFFEDETRAQRMSDSFYRADPEGFWPEYKAVFLRPEFLAAKPNPGHLALAELERMGKDITILTQNVDGLHAAAGSAHVLELHGNIHAAFCPRCGARYTLDEILANDVPHCHAYTLKGGDCQEILQPDIVLFEQPVRHYQEAFYAVARADLLLIIGSSLTVEPVASLPQYASHAAKRVVINLEPTDLDEHADLCFYERQAEVFAAILAD